MYVSDIVFDIKIASVFSRFKIPLILLISKYKVKLKRRLTQPLHIVALKYLQCTFKESVVYISLATHKKKKFCDKWLLLCFHLHYFLKWAHPPIDLIIVMIMMGTRHLLTKVLASITPGCGSYFISFFCSKIEEVEIRECKWSKMGESADNPISA